MSNDIVDQYFKEIEGEEYNPISNDEIKKLVRIAQSGYDKEKKEWMSEEAIEARNEIMKRNIRFVPYVLHTVIRQKRSPLFLECVNECYFSIIKCIICYDASDECQTSFATYAQNAICRHAWRFLRENNSSVKLPSKKLSARAKNENEIYSNPGCLDRFFKKDFEPVNYVFSLNYDFDDGEKNHLNCFDDIPIKDDPDKNLNREELKDIILEALKCLDDKERIIVTKRYLSDEKDTLKELSLEIGLTGERVRQIEQKALIKLKDFMDENNYEK